jgi:hypothetical protein
MGPKNRIQSWPKKVVNVEHALHNIYDGYLIVGISGYVV